MNDAHQLDLRGLKCPMPALKTRKALQRLATGALLEVLTTDPMAAIDVPHAAVQSGGRMLEQAAHEGGMRFLIRKAD